MSKRAFYRVVWILSALAIAGMTAVFASQPYALPIPGPTKTYTSGDKSLRLDHPGNWKVREFSSHGIETELRVEPARSAKFVVTADLQGSLMADIVKSGNNALSSLTGMGGEAGAQPKSPLETLH